MRAWKKLLCKKDLLPGRSCNKHCPNVRLIPITGMRAGCWPKTKPGAIPFAIFTDVKILRAGPCGFCLARKFFDARNQKHRAALGKQLGLSALSFAPGKAVCLLRHPTKKRNRLKAVPFVKWSGCGAGRRNGGKTRRHRMDWRAPAPA